MFTIMLEINWKFIQESGVNQPEWLEPGKGAVGTEEIVLEAFWNSGAYLVHTTATTSMWRSHVDVDGPHHLADKVHLPFLVRL
jgi:hypothetical protein